VFEVHRDLNASDAALRTTFEDILRDEKYHVAYTERFLERWTAAGLGDEVQKGLGSARTSRFLGAWKRLGLRSGAGFSQMLLFVSYCTLLAPFGILARFGKPAPAARDLPAVKAERSLRGQA
jgi:hypothetical protein